MLLPLLRCALAQQGRHCLPFMALLLLTVIATNSFARTDLPGVGSPMVYCTPPISNCGSNATITRVVVGTIDNTTVCSASGYGNYTVSVAAGNMEAGKNHNFSITVGSAVNSSVAIWMDLNKNNVFEAADLVYGCCYSWNNIGFR